MPGFFSGPANVASVSRDAFALDARTMILRREDISVFEEIMKVPYVENPKERDEAYCNRLDEGIWRQRSLAFCALLRERGLRLVWNPGEEIGGFVLWIKSKVRRFKRGINI